MKMKKITFILGGMKKGGAERVVSNLVNFWARKGYDVEIIMLLVNQVEYELDKNVRTVDFTTGMSYRKSLIYWYKALRNYMKKNKDRTIISFFLKINFLTLLASLGLEAKVIVSERTDPFSDGRSKVLNTITNILYRKADCLVLQTNEIAELMKHKVRCPIRVIYNPVSVKKENINIYPKNRTIVSVGNLKAAKNYDMVINTVYQIKEKLNGYTWIIYGEGPLREELEKKIYKLGLNEIIKLPGSIDNVPSHINKSCMFIITSNYEGMSNALQEALSMGLCCISTDCLGAKDLITDQVNGFIVERENEKQLSSLIMALLGDDEKRKQVGYSAYQKSKSYYIESIIDKWEQII